METTNISIGKYRFKIIDNILTYNEKIYSRNCKLCGNVSYSVTISIRYNNSDEAVSAYIYHNDNDPEYDIDINLEKEEFTNIMIKTLLEYVHKKIPTITEVYFEDESNIEIQNKSEYREKRKKIYSIPLYYFSIAFNGVTWYEEQFNAHQKDESKHIQYREKIKNLLYFKEEKSNTTFIQFLQIIQPTNDVIDELLKYYNNSTTFGDFFTSIPKMDRCRLVGDWISRFMKYYLNDVFSNTDWIIELPVTMRGGKMNTRKYYCPKGRICHNRTYNDLGIGVDDV